MVAHDGAAAVHRRDRRGPCAGIGTARRWGSSRTRRALPATPPAAAPGAALGAVLAPGPVPVPAAAMAVAAAGVPAAVAAALAGAPVAALAAVPPVRAVPASASRVPAALLDQHLERALVLSWGALRRRAPWAHGNDLRAPGDDSQPGPSPTMRRQTCIDVLCAYLRCPVSRMSVASPGNSRIRAPGCAGEVRGSGIRAGKAHPRPCLRIRRLNRKSVLSWARGSTRRSAAGPGLDRAGWLGGVLEGDLHP